MDEDEWLAIGSIITVSGILIICMSTTIYHCTKKYIFIEQNVSVQDNYSEII
jgi:hypothetical protein